MNKIKTKNHRTKTHKSQSAREQVNKNHVEINKIEQSNRIKYTKVEYCPMISNMLKNKNKKIKSPIVFSFVEFLDLFEKLYYRSVCKQWNEIIKQKLPFLGQENFLNCVINKSAMTSFKKYLTNSHKKQNSYTNHQNITQSNFHNEKLTDRVCFGNSDQKFSKKKVLIKLISSKNFNLIKSKVCLGEMTKAKILGEDD